MAEGEWSLIKEFSIFLKKINDVKGLVNGFTILLVLSITMKNYVASPTKNTEHSKQFKTGVQKPYPVWGQNDQIRYSISDQNVFKSKCSVSKLVKPTNELK